MPNVGTIIVFGLILLALILFLTELIPNDMTAIGVIVSLAVLEPYIGINAREAILGFANPATITIVAMYIISRGVEKTGLVDELGNLIASVTKGNEGGLFAATVGTTGTLAGIVNNTPVVAVFIPMITNLAERINRSPSRFLMPLSFSAMLGGTLTLLGTSTNLLASDFARRTLGESLSMFEFTHLGVVTFIIGSIYLFTVGRWLLPDRVEPRGQHIEEYRVKPSLSQLYVTEDSPLVNAPVTEAFADEEDLEVEFIQFHRNGEAFLVAGSDRFIQPGDLLILKVQPDRKSTLIERFNLKRKRTDGVSDRLLEKTDFSGELTEVVILPESPFVGRALGELDIEENYRTSVLSVRRQDEILTQSIDEVTLEAGDQLLLLSSGTSAELLAESESLVITDRGESEQEPDRSEQPGFDTRSTLSVGILISVIVLAALEVLPIVIAALAGVFAMVTTGCLTSGEAYEAVSWNIIFLLAGVLPLGMAMEQTGGADLIAQGLVASAAVLPLIGVLWLSFLITSLLANIITPVASIVLMLPVVASAAQTLGASTYSFIITTMFASACAFMTPIGYQTNLMVYGPGGYTFMDYVKVGGPLQLLISVVVPIGAVVLWGI